MERPRPSPLARLYAPALAPPRERDERGDVPGWVMITVMTAGLVVVIWAIAGRPAQGDARRPRSTR